jgi:hypothetical protein
MANTITIELDVKKISRRVRKAWEKGLPQLSGEILNDCNQYCKEKTGALIASSLTASKLDEGQLIWDTPYAARQYWKIQTAHTDVNPNASWKWCDVAKAANQETWNRQAQLLLEQNL